MQSSADAHDVRFGGLFGCQGTDVWNHDFCIGRRFVGNSDGDVVSEISRNCRERIGECCIIAVKVKDEADRPAVGVSTDS
jgi:hypothetical protein